MPLFLRIIALLACLLPYAAKADYHLTSQAAVNAFAHSGYLETGIRIIPVWGGSRTDITDLSPLANITGLKGDLIITGNPDLESLEGLHNISSIRNLILEDNGALKNLDGLRGLTAIGNSMILERNLKLETVQGLAHIVHDDPFYLTVSRNESLKHLDGLEWIKDLTGQFIIEWNPRLEHLNGLSGLQSIEKSLIIRQNKSLKHVDGLASLRTIGENLHLIGLTSLVQIDGLRNLSIIPWELTIGGNDVLQNLDGFSGLRKVNGPIQLIENLSLSNLDGFRNLDKINRILDIVENPKITTLDVFSTIKLSTLTSIAVIRNDKLEDITGLCNLIHPTWPSPRVLILENPALKVCTPILQWERKAGMEMEIMDNHPDCDDDEVLEALDPCPDPLDKLNENDGDEEGKVQMLHPNPLSGNACWVPFSLEESGRIQISVIDQLGRNLGFWHEQSFTEGDQLLRLNPADLPQGWNYLVLQSKEKGFRKAWLYYKP